MKNKPLSLVSIIVPTKNEEANIDNLLKSIKSQTYKKIEIIVVDNNSDDNTRKIASKYTSKIYLKSPERSRQRNFGAQKAKGKYLLFLDADMVLSKKIVTACVECIEKDPEIGALVVPEKSYGTSFWAKCKRLEKSFYEGVDWIEGVRFFKKETFIKLKGFNSKLISGEDWDIHARTKKIVKVSRVSEYIFHNEGNLTLKKTIQKKFYYAKNIYAYKSFSEPNLYKKQSNIFLRFYVFLEKPGKLFKDPLVGFGMLFMKMCEYLAGALGYMIALNNEKLNK